MNNESIAPKISKQKEATQIHKGSLLMPMENPLFWM